MSHPTRFITLIIFFALSLTSCQKKVPEQSDEKKRMRALIVDGQNNHGIWPMTTMMMKGYLEETGMFTVDVARTAFTWQGPHNDDDDNFGAEARSRLVGEFPIAGGKETKTVDKPEADPDFKPDFSAYDLVISNFGWTAAPWPKETEAALEQFVSNGGGLVIVHAANNSFPDWLEYNKMIGLGGWGDRTERNGPYIYYDKAAMLLRDTTAGPGGSHGHQHEFLITIRDAEHPVTKGMPAQWLHAKDEMYDRLRGPAENLSVLATAFSDIEKNASFFSPLKGTDRNEPMMLTINYGKGRVFHTPLGHTYYSMECVGFITLLQRGAEWAATGSVTQTVPADFPTAEKTSVRKFNAGH